MRQAEEQGLKGRGAEQERVSGGVEDQDFRDVSVVSWE